MCFLSCSTFSGDGFQVSDLPLCSHVIPPCVTPWRLQFTRGSSSARCVKSATRFEMPACPPSRSYKDSLLVACAASFVRPVGEGASPLSDFFTLAFLTPFSPPPSPEPSSCSA